MKHVDRVFEIYTRKIAVQLFGIALLFCGVWWLQILPHHEEHKWDAFLGVLAAVLAVLLEQLAEAVSRYRKFYMLAGHYECRGYAEESPEDACRVLSIDDGELERQLANNPDLTYLNGAEADIEYRGEANLHVDLKEGTHDNTWNGDCIMESDAVGIMPWAYTKLGSRANPWARNGLKRLSVVDRNKPLKICLHSYNNDGRFGRELLIKENHSIRDAYIGEWPDNWRLQLVLVCASVLTLVIFVRYG